MNKLTVILFGVLISLISCNDLEQAKLIQGKWKCVEWKVDEQKHNATDEVSFTFSEDKTYEYKNQTLEEVGTYKIEGGNLYTKANGDLEIAVQIEKLTQDTLMFNMSRAGTPETMTLVKN